MCLFLFLELFAMTDELQESQGPSCVGVANMNMNDATGHVS